jgi:phenylalanyl-tRNA synthetase beta chain
MLISLDWLNDFVDLSDRQTDEVEHDLTMLGLEAVLKGPLASGEKQVVGLVISVEKHPDADRLSVCSVDVGDAEPRTIVCGAPNVAAGQKVAVALPGAVLPGDFKIKKAKIRGVKSEGMICAEDELGLGDDHDGIIVLSDDAPVGESLTRYLNIDSERADIDLTPNRGDAMSHLGCARDIAATLDRELLRPDPDVIEDGESIDGMISIEIEDPDGCTRYVARVIRDVTVGPSPEWLTGRLRQVGLRPINNVVDATNYVLMAVGHPLHAFDLNRVADRSIIVRAAAPGEAFTTLDGQSREMPGGTVMICDAERSVAVGGVMGGENSEISNTTTDVLLEAACFDPARIRRASKALGLSTDASQRFERGIDSENAIRAIDWCAELIRHIAGGRIANGRIDVHPTPFVGVEINIRWAQIPRILGIDIPRDEVERQMSALGIEILASDDTGLRVMQPSWRSDLTREIDLIEEVARLWGYDRIPSSGSASSISSATESLDLKLVDDARSWLVEMGLQEVVTSSLVPEAQTEMVQTPRKAVQLANWSSAEMSHLRTHLLPSLLSVVRHNLRQKSAKGVALFEIGTVYGEVDGKYQEHREIVVLFAGQTPGVNWSDTNRQYDYFDMKGVVESLVQRSSLLSPGLVPYDLSGYVSRTGTHIQVAEDEVGTMGQIDASLCDVFDLTVPVFFARIDLASLVKHRNVLSEVAPLPRYPAVERDLALVVPEAVPARELETIVHASGAPLIERVVLFDVYRGKGLETGEKSLGFNLEFRAKDRTLTDQEVDELVHHMVIVAGKQVSARVRT